MIPVLSIGPFDLPPYFTFLMVAYMVGIAVSAFEARRVGMNVARVIDANIAIFLASLVASRLGSILFDGYLAEYWNACFSPELVSPAHRGWDCFEALRVWHGGFQYYGGFVGGIAALAICVWRFRLPVAPTFDLWGYAVPAGLAFGRIGCFLAGCCYGVPSDLPWAVSFPAGSLAAEILAVAPTPRLHPTQLYEAAFCLAIFLFNFVVLRKRQRRDGAVWWAFCVFYAAGRFAVEFVRADPRGDALGLSTSQWGALAVLTIAAVVVRRYRVFSPPAQHERGSHAA